MVLKESQSKRRELQKSINKRNTGIEPRLSVKDMPSHKWLHWSYVLNLIPNKSWSNQQLQYNNLQSKKFLIPLSCRWVKLRQLQMIKCY